MQAIRIAAISRFLFTTKSSQENKEDCQLFFRFIFLQVRHSNQNINSRQNKKILSNPVRFGKQIRRWLLAPLDDEE